jgi:putative acetyltransferase
MLLPDPLEIVRTSFRHLDFNAMIIELDEDLRSRYGSEQDIYDQYNKIAHIDTVIVAYENGRAVGCGCFKPYDDDTVEVKRMFVRPQYRGKGISKIILKELERWASEMRYQKIVLETGMEQPEAIGLYKRLGYRVIDNFGHYQNMSTSVCFEKQLT